MLLKNKEEIECWLNQYEIQNYELIPDKEYEYVVNVNEDVDLWNKELNNIDVKFNIVNGYFDCSQNKLESLVGCPKVINGNFYCSDNDLVSLNGGPEIIQGNFYCAFNKLESLVGFPEIINGNFYCNNNELKLNKLSQLLSKKMKINIIDLDNNIELGDLQKIDDFNEIKKILIIYQEKADLMKILEVTDKSAVENLDLLINNKDYNIEKKINKI